MVVYQKKLKLNDENILILQKGAVGAYEVAAKKRATDLLKLQLTVEEILLDFRDCYGTETPCKVTVSRSLGRIHMAFEQKGAQSNPLDNSAYDDACVDILTALDVIPKYSYRNKSGSNVVHLTPEIKDRKNQTIINILVAVLFAVLCFFLMQLLAPSTQASIADAVIEPLFNKLMAVITTVATPLVFFAILNGIVEIGDIRSLGTVGRIFTREMFRTYIFTGIAFTIPVAIIYGLDNASSVGNTGFIKQMIQLVLDIVPDNLLAPFTVDNDLQVVAVALLIGAAIICMGEKAAGIKEVLGVISDVVNQMMMIVLKVLPLIVFTGTLNIMCQNMTGLGRLWIVFVLFVIVSSVIEGYLIIRVKRSFKGVSIRDMFRKQLPTTIINLTTSSQVSAYPANITCCRDGFGIRSKFVDFGLPLGIVMYMPNGAVFFGLTVWSLADLAGMPIGISQMIIIFIMSIVIAIAAPPIPGSALTVMPMMLSICSIPSAYFPIAVLLGTVIGYFLPLLNGYCLQLQMLIDAKKLDMVDESILYRPAKQ